MFMHEAMKKMYRKTEFQGIFHKLAAVDRSKLSNLFSHAEISVNLIQFDRVISVFLTFDCDAVYHNWEINLQKASCVC